MVCTLHIGSGDFYQVIFCNYWHVALQSRPFGVALLFGGIDDKGPQL